jgi:hypothetical protein
MKGRFCQPRPKAAEGLGNGHFDIVSALKGPFAGSGKV